MFKVVIVVLFCAQNSLATPQEQLKEYKKTLSSNPCVKPYEEALSQQNFLFIMIEKNIKKCSGIKDIVDITAELSQLKASQTAIDNQFKLIESNPFFVLLNKIKGKINDCELACRPSAADDCDSCVKEIDLSQLTKLCTEEQQMILDRLENYEAEKDNLFEKLQDIFKNLDKYCILSTE